MLDLKITTLGLQGSPLFFRRLSSIKKLFQKAKLLLFELLPSDKQKILQRHSMIELAFVDTNKIHDLNKEFYKKAKPTDILTFPLLEGGLLATIAISPSDAYQKWRAEFRMFPVFECFLVFLIIHGILHALYGAHRKFALLEDQFMQLYSQQVCLTKPREK